MNIIQRLLSYQISRHEALQTQNNDSYVVRARFVFANKLAYPGRDFTLLLEALSKIINLEVFKFDIEGKITWGTPSVIEKNGCKLKELVMHVERKPSESLDSPATFQISNLRIRIIGETLETVKILITPCCSFSMIVCHHFKNTPYNLALVLHRQPVSFRRSRATQPT